MLIDEICEKLESEGFLAHTEQVAIAVFNREIPKPPHNEFGQLVFTLEHLEALRGVLRRKP